MDWLRSSVCNWGSIVSMAIDRRTFLKTACTGLLIGPAGVARGTSTDFLMSCRGNGQGQYFATLFHSGGGVLMDVALPGRGHGIAVNPTQTQAVVFARRPGDFMVVIDLLTLSVHTSVNAIEGRHFYGHGAYSRDGRTLYVTENAYQTGAGKIGVYDCASGFKRVAEIDSHGIGPHEIGLLNNNNVLVVANGGIRTHPDLPRVKANLATMQSSLAYVDLSDGRLLHDHRPEVQWHQLSIRHIDIAPDDRVAIAMQFEGKRQLRPPLIAIQQGREQMQMLSAPDAVHKRLRNYCGSVCFSQNGERFAVSSPRGGLVTFWSARGDYLGTHEQADACGVGRTPKHQEGFFVSDGSGTVVRLGRDLADRGHWSSPNWRWDNHLVAVGTE